MRKLLCVLVAVAIVVGGVAVTNAAPKKSPEEQFKALDKDGDQKVSLEEFTAGKEGKKKEAAEKQFKAKDKDKDGNLTLEEFKGKPKKKAE